MNPEILGLLARVATLEQLLEVYERSVLEQSDRLYREQEQLRLQTTLLECQGESSLDGILSASVDGTILFANQRLAELWDMAPPQVGAKTCEAVLRAMAMRTQDSHRFTTRLADLLCREDRREELSLANGRTLDGYAAPILSKEGDFFGRVWYFHDISELKRINRLKDDFIATVSHELRTPLTSIRGSLGLLAGGMAGELPEEAMALARVAQANCERLVRLVGDILDIEKIEAGKMELALKPMALAPLVERSIESVRPYGAQLGVDFRWQTSVLGARVQVDADRLGQVMANLLSNAAKFSRPGSHVDVTLHRKGDALRVSVSDHGKGISPQFRSRIFEKFAQGERSTTRGKGGTGLGLSITRAIVERLGGSIGFESEVEVGTTFYFDLPEWRGV